MELVKGIIENKKKKKVKEFYDKYVSKGEKNKDKRLTKKNLAVLIHKGLFEENKILEVFSNLFDSEIDILLEATNHPFRLARANFLQGGKLDSLMLGNYNENLRVFFIYNEIRSFILHSYKDDIKEKITKQNWILRCTRFCEQFYQYTPLGIFMRLVRQNRNINIDKEESIKLFNELNKNDIKSFYDEKALAFFNYAKSDNDIEYYEIFEIQKDKSFYIPSKEEIDEYYEKNCFRNKYYDMLFDNIKTEPFLKKILYASVYKDLSSQNCNEDEYVNLFVDIISLDCSKEEKTKFVKDMLRKANNTIRKKCFRGHTREENKTIIRKEIPNILEGDSKESRMLREAMCSTV